MFSKIYLCPVYSAQFKQVLGIPTLYFVHHFGKWICQLVFYNTKFPFLLFLVWYYRISFQDADVLSVK